jgi:hypothetical protein
MNVPSAMSTKNLRLAGIYLTGTFGTRNYEGNVRSHEHTGIVYKCQVVLQCMMCDNWFHLSPHTRIKVTLPAQSHGHISVLGVWFSVTHCQ